MTENNYVNRGLHDIVRRFEGTRVLVIGDCMLDEYIYGECNRISPEAPIPVVLCNEKCDFLGGAANVSANIKAVGGEPLLVGVVGDDESGERLRKALGERKISDNGLVVSHSRPTTLKTRIVAQNQQIIRLDREVFDDLSDEDLSSVKERFDGVIDSVGAVVISDYGKGVINRAVLKHIRDVIGKEDIKTVVDPKVSHFEYYKGMTVITPNHREASDVCDINIVDEITMTRAGKTLIDRVGCENVLITWGERGMVLFRNGQEDMPVFIDATARSVYDVTGAGDTVVAVLSLALANGASIVDASRIANYAGGIVVGKLGTSTVLKSELIEIIEKGS